MLLTLSCLGAVWTRLMRALMMASGHVKSTITVNATHDTPRQIETTAIAGTIFRPLLFNENIIHSSTLASPLYLTPSSSPPIRLHHLRKKPTVDRSARA